MLQKTVVSILATPYPPSFSETLLWRKPAAML